ncbi:hypothetical protein Goshw_024579 [Gossypium schwendimanii]|uniref:DUF4283 domain-containing protein n=1 Tax=Gossypium schwendimanii TaxID=34291 RepID=A0A7J9MVC8_GOSSC|nr:hypothetical protein [Gossypium schwendimanii]
MVVVEETPADLFISEEEEVALPLGSKGSEGGMFYGNCFVGSFLTSSVINFQFMRSTLANVWHLIGSISISNLNEGHYLFRLMRIGLRQGLGHEEGFCPIWILQEKYNFELEWDIILRAPARQVMVPTSIWLKEDTITKGQIKGMSNPINRGMMATVKNNVGWVSSTGLRNRAFAGLIDVLVQSQPIGLIHVDRDELPGPIPRKIQTPRVDYITIVLDLLMYDSMGWNFALIDFVFSPDEADLIKKSDAWAVICKLKATSEDLSEISAFICEATELSKWFLVRRFTYLARSGNWAMHTVAQEGMSWRKDGFWVEEAPVLATLVADEDKRLIDPP